MKVIHAGRRRIPKVSLIFAWYDFWVGLFWDRARRRLYVFPAPMVGLLFDFELPIPDQFIVVEDARTERELIASMLYREAAAYEASGMSDRAETLRWHTGSVVACDHRRKAPK